MVTYDFYQISEVFVKKLENIFNDPRTAKVALAASLSILCICCYLWFSLVVTYKSWEIPKLQDVTQNPKTTSPTISIAQKHLFGSNYKPGSTLSNALKSKLPLTLKGVIADTNPKLGSVIIATKDAEEESYQVGDKIPVNGTKVTLEYIFKDKIYIKNSQSLEYILYPKLEQKLDVTGNSASGMAKSSRGAKRRGQSKFLPNINSRVGDDDDNDDDEDRDRARPGIFDKRKLLDKVRQNRYKLLKRNKANKTNTKYRAR